MLFSKRLPLGGLIDLCRALRHQLAAGLTLRDVFRQQARKGLYGVRPVAERISQKLEAGDSLEDALREEQKYFPPLFLALAGVGEHTGHLPEIFGMLENYYLMEQRFWRQFWSACTLPILQFFGAIGIIAFMLLVLGFLGSPIDPLGVGTGPAGALRFVVAVLTPLAVLIVAYALLSRSLEQKAVADLVIMRLPAVGPLVESLSLSRLCLALHLTLDTSLPAPRALELSLRGTGNAAYVKKTRVVQEALRNGDTLHEALVAANIFPDDFLHLVAVGEEGGRVPEIMLTRAKQYEEQAELRLKVLARVAGFGVWLVVAMFIIFLIFRLAGVYFNAISNIPV